MIDTEDDYHVRFNGENEANEASLSDTDPGPVLPGSA